MEGVEEVRRRRKREKEKLKEKEDFMSRYKNKKAG
jgi:hypothetical protein